MTRARTLADMISDGVIGTTELADDVITPVKLDETGSYTIAQLDVNGTLTADGLTVDGDATVSSANARIRMFETDTTDLNTQLQSTGGDFFLKTIPDDASTSKTRFSIDHSSGDISFYEDQGTTPKFHWSAADERLGIGTSSPRVPIDVAGAGATTGGVTSHAVLSDTASFAINKGGLLSFEGKYNTAGNPASWASIGGLKENATDGNYAGYLQFNTRANGANQTERMRLDSSGNLLVGTTDANLYNTSTETGVALRNNEKSAFSRDGGVPLYINRLSSDGGLLYFQKDGSTVGSIGTESTDTTLQADLYIKGRSTVGGTNENNSRLWLLGGDSGIVLDGHTNSILPTDENSYEDGRTDIGSADYRFKDLYLSGGVVFGATSGSVTSKTLDDYEEGTFTPLYHGTGTYGSTTYTVQRGNYTKIGDNVHVEINLSISATTATGNAVIQGLPFTSANNQNAIGSVMANSYNFSTSSGWVVAYIVANTADDMRLYLSIDNTGWVRQPIDTSFDLYITVDYTAA